MTEGRNGIPPVDDTKIVFSYHRIIEPLAVIDGLLHKARVSNWPLFWRLCDAYDLSLGTPDTPENFPRRWSRRGN